MTFEEAIAAAEQFHATAKILSDLAAQVEELRADAERYRYYIESSPNGEMCFMGEFYSGKKALDDAIDAARKSK